MIRVRTVRMIAVCAVIGLLASCAGFHYRSAADRGAAALLARPVPPYPAVRFAVISDPHLYDTGLGVQGAAKTRITITEPSGRIRQTDCSSSPCAVTIDQRQGSALMQVQYLSAPPPAR